MFTSCDRPKSRTRVIVKFLCHYIVTVRRYLGAMWKSTKKLRIVMYISCFYGYRLYVETGYHVDINWRSQTLTAHLLFLWLQVVRGDRVPCGHQLETSESYCTSLGCCWDPTTYEHENKTHCFYPSGKQNYF